MASSKQDATNAQLLVFNGDRKMFKVWLDTLSAELKKKTLAMRKEWLKNHDTRPEPLFTYEGLLQSAFEIPLTVKTPADEDSQDDDDMDATIMDKAAVAWQRLYLDEAVADIRAMLYKFSPQVFVQQNRDTYMDGAIHDIVKMLERRYGDSDLTSLRASYRKLTNCPKQEWTNVQSLIGDMKMHFATVNTQAIGALGRKIVTPEVVLLSILNAIPSQFYGGQISLDKDFTLAKVEAKLVSIYGSRSKKDIVGADSAGRMPNNHVVQGRGGRGARGVQDHQVNQVDQADLRKRKVDVDDGKCRFCFKAGHVKDDCVQRKKEFKDGKFRSNVNKSWKVGQPKDLDAEGSSKFKKMKATHHVKHEVDASMSQDVDMDDMYDDEGDIGVHHVRSVIETSDESQVPTASPSDTVSNAEVQAPVGPSNDPTSIEALSKSVTQMQVQLEQKVQELYPQLL